VARAIYAERRALSLRWIPAAHKAHADRKDRQRNADEKTAHEQLPVARNQADQKRWHDGAGHHDCKDDATAVSVGEYTERNATEATEQNRQRNREAYLKRCELQCFFEGRHHRRHRTEDRKA